MSYDELSSILNSKSCYSGMKSPNLENIDTFGNSTNYFDVDLSLSDKDSIKVDIYDLEIVSLNKRIKDLENINQKLLNTNIMLQKKVKYLLLKCPQSITKEGSEQILASKKKNERMNNLNKELEKKLSEMVQINRKYEEYIDKLQTKIKRYDLHNKTMKSKIQELEIKKIENTENDDIILENISLRLELAHMNDMLCSYRNMIGKKSQHSKSQNIPNSIIAAPPPLRRKLKENTQRSISCMRKEPLSEINTNIMTHRSMNKNIVKSNRKENRAILVEADDDLDYSIPSNKYKLDGDNSYLVFD